MSGQLFQNVGTNILNFIITAIVCYSLSLAFKSRPVVYCNNWLWESIHRGAWSQSIYNTCWAWFIYFAKVISDRHILEMKMKCLHFVEGSVYLTVHIVAKYIMYECCRDWVSFEASLRLHVQAMKIKAWFSVYIYIRSTPLSSNMIIDAKSSVLWLIYNVICKWTAS